MKEFFEKIVNSKKVVGLIFLAVFYCMINSRFNMAQAAMTLTNYVPAVNIYIQDENAEPVGYLVKQTTVQEIISDLSYELGEEDYTEPTLDTVVEDGVVIHINRVTYTYSSTVEEIPYETEFVTRGGSIRTTRIANQGKVGTMQHNFKTKLINGVEVSTEPSGDEVIEQPVNKVVEYNSIAEGATWTGRLTSYGYDCPGCGGGTSAGARLNANGVNNSGTAKITYHGQQYYVLAADRSIPFCSIIKIENHGFGMESTAYGIVLDRGSGVTGGHIDIFNGSERGRTFFRGGNNYNTTFTIVSVGRGNAYCFNQ